MSNRVEWIKITDPEYVKAIIAVRKKEHDDNLFNRVKVFFELNISEAERRISRKFKAAVCKVVPELKRNYSQDNLIFEEKELVGTGADNLLYHSLRETPVHDRQTLGEISVGYDDYDIGFTNNHRVRGDTRLAVPQTLFKAAGLDKL